MTDSTTVATIGESIVFKGELSGDVALVIDGQVEGRIYLNRNALTVGEHGKIKATVVAKTVVVAGKVRGDIMAAEKVGIRDTCSMEGNICTPRLAMAPGAYVRGRIDIPQSQSGRAAAAATANRIVHAPAKFRAKYAAKPKSVMASGARGLKS